MSFILIWRFSIQTYVLVKWKGKGWLTDPPPLTPGTVMGPIAVALSISFAASATSVTNSILFSSLANCSQYCADAAKRREASDMSYAEACTLNFGFGWNLQYVFLPSHKPNTSRLTETTQLTDKPIIKMSKYHSLSTTWPEGFCELKRPTGSCQ